MWDQIKHRFTTLDGSLFWACIDGTGAWIDSAQDFDLAVHWCAMDIDSGYASDVNASADQARRQAHALMQQHGYSIIHSSQLERMANAGLIH